MTYKGFVVYPLETGWVLEYLTDEIFEDEVSVRVRVDAIKQKKTLYIIKYWNPSRGTTEENPTDFEGQNNSFYKELKNIKPEDCYKSWKMAKRLAEKYNRLLQKNGLGRRYKVVEVPEDALTISKTR